jgi:hypothetical protein
MSEVVRIINKMIKELIKLATHLDNKGLAKEADYLDSIIKKANAATPKVAEDLISLLNNNGYEARATGRKQNESGVWAVNIYINKADEDGDSWNGECWLSTGSAQKSF